MSDNKERTLYCGNLHDRVTEDILYELFLQAGPLENVTIPKDKDGRPRKFAFITFKHAVSVPYTVALMDGIALYGRALTLNPRDNSASEHNPYLEKLKQYQNRTHLMSDRNYPTPYLEPSQRHDARRYNPRNEPQRSDYSDSWNQYSASPPQYGISSPIYNTPLPSGRYAPNTLPYSNQYRDRTPWSRNHR